MTIPFWLVIAGIALIVMLALLVFGKRESGEMLERQRLASPLSRARAPADEDELMARPEIAEAMNRGHKIQAIKLVKAATGMGLRDAKHLVERHFR